MGQKARLRRKWIKTIAIRQGYKEDEFGELKKVTTKAEARRRFVERVYRLREWEKEIVERVTRQAVEELQAEEDHLFFASLAGATL